MPQKELCLRELLPEICNAAAALAMQPKFAPIEDDLRADVWLDSNASVSIALVLNELIQNALKHGSQREVAEVSISLAGDENRVSARICNPGTALPPDFDFAADKGYGTGLGLVRTLLPRHGAQLDFTCDGKQICAELVLSQPVIVRLVAAPKSAKESS
jgi:two-component sensor histidine kinase